MPPKKVLRNVRITPPVLKKNPNPPATWDLYTHGLSYSGISKFLICRERFRIRYVENLVPSGTKEVIEFGSIFHKALEFGAQGNSQTQIFKKLHRLKSNRFNTSGFDPLLCRIVSLMVPRYLEFWKEDFKKIQYFETEKPFTFFHSLPGTTPVPIHGIRDQGFLREGGMWLQENKTKSRVQEDQIVQTLGYSLQPMMYLLSMKLEFPGRPLGGILYNIIRKPQLQRKVKESESDFLTRISKDIDSQPSHYFKMFEVEVDDSHLRDWQLRYFDPLIHQIVLWWESIKTHPFDPWVGEDGLPNPHHFIRPFGVYDPMSQGLGDYFGRVVQGHDAGLEKGKSYFPELESLSP